MGGKVIIESEREKKEKSNMFTTREKSYAFFVKVAFLATTVAASATFLLPFAFFPLPKVFEMAPREQMKKGMQQMFNAEDMTIEF